MKVLASGIGALFANIRAALCLIAGKSSGLSGFRLGAGALIGLFAVILLCESLVALVTFYPTAKFSIWGLHSFALLVCSMMIISWLLVTIARMQWRFRVVLTIWVAGLACIVVPVSLLSITGLYSDSGSQLTMIVVPIVGLLVHTLLLYRIARLGLGFRRVRASVAGVVVSAVFFGSNMAVPNSELWTYDWTAQYDEQYHYEPRLNNEYVYYRQPAMLREATDRVAQGRPGSTELYYLGFGGEGDNVFRNESLAVRSIVDDQLGSASRSAVLINNVDTVDQYPIASVHNLQVMLKQIATKMNVEEDVLMLYLTSHGSADHELSVELESLGLNQLPARQLAALVADTDIKWKVIVISACYSGGFIEPLKDDYTIVITASRHDRLSFGCSSENDFTYFGNAYFNEAIQHGAGILAAFDLAVESIRAREQVESLTPSEPQIFVGEKIKDHLRHFDLPHHHADMAFGE